MALQTCTSGMEKVAKYHVHKTSTLKLEVVNTSTFIVDFLLGEEKGGFDDDDDVEKNILSQVEFCRIFFFNI